MFVDYVEILAASGKGGDGLVAFRREKYIPKGGPSGGDGGHGGSVIIRSSPGVQTLIDFRHRHHFRAENGQPGGANRRTGRSAEDLFILVPVGTVVREKGGAVLADLNRPGAEFPVARGGQGGWGNARFATSVRQAPRFARPGKPGEERQLVLELKLIADVGLVGYPNSGKSTLLSVISNSRPRIAPYPFTTLEPCLGLVKVPDGSSFVAADLPGLIEGAHQGRGLGDRFLRHIERTRFLLHLVDLSEAEPLERYRKIRRELVAYGCGLETKPELVVGTKLDLPEARRRAPAFKRELAREGRESLVICAVSGQGLESLLRSVAGRLRELGR